MKRLRIYGALAAIAGTIGLFSRISIDPNTPAAFGSIDLAIVCVLLSGLFAFIAGRLLQ